MQKTHKPVVSCILILIAGCYMILLITPALLIGGGMYSIHWKQTAFFIASMMTLTIGIMAVISGIFARSRKRWRYAIAGSVCVILAGSVFTAFDMMVLEVESFDIFSMTAYLIPAFITIPALILLMLSKKEFGQPEKPDPTVTK